MKASRKDSILFLNHKKIISLTKLKCLIIAAILILHGWTLLSQSEVNIKKFEPNIISTELVEYALSFSKDGKEAFFARSSDGWGQGKMKSAIYRSILRNDKWSAPKIASFSGQYDDSDPHLSSDGKVMYFVSDRPSDHSPISQDIWKVERNTRGEWGVPKRLDNPINSPNREYSPRTDDKGNLYFASDRDHGFGQGDLYMADHKDGKYAEPINLGKSINSKNGEWNLEVNGAGDMIIFEASGRPENVSGYGDLYISFKLKDKWSKPQNITELNTSGSDLYPQLVNDDSLLFYSSSKSIKSPDVNIYFVEFEQLRSKYKASAEYMVE